MQNYIWPLVLPLLFVAYSLPLFLCVYATTESVIDEEFHLRQGLHFCNKRFNVWDPKITTFPGLYLFSLVLNPLQLCSVLGLRMISLTAAAFNVVLLYKIRRRSLGGTNSSVAALDAFTLSFLPPLYFFSHLYYTDALSLTWVLLFYHYWLKDDQLIGGVCAATSVLMRQTNIVWVGMALGITVLDIFRQNYAEMKRVTQANVNFFNLKVWCEMLTSLNFLLKSTTQIMRKCYIYLVIIFPFVGFVWLNGSIVIGDKRAHEATLHLPQLFYFSVFTMIFGISNLLQKLRTALGLLRRKKLIMCFLLGICILIVKCNTLVHPYLLADNRHYTFYIWNRFYGRYSWFKYAITPVYIIALTLIYCGLQHMRDSFKIMFWIAVVLVLCFQRLLEIRYFLIPFIIFRLNTPICMKNRWRQWAELLLYMVVNALTFYIFLHKEIKWTNFKEPQRIIW